MSAVPRHETSDPSLIDWLRTIGDGWQALIVGLVLGIILGVGATALQLPQYRATGSVVVTPTQFLDPNAAAQLPTLTGTVQRLAGTTAVLGPASRAYAALAPDAVSRAERRAIATPAWLADHLEVVQAGGSSIIEISGTAGRQRDANDLTRATVATLTTVINKLASTRQAVIRTGTGTARATTQPSTGGIRLKIFTPSTPVGQVSPTPARNVAIGINVGLILGGIGALLLGLSRRRIRKPGDIEASLRAPVIGEIRDMDGKLDFEPGLISARAFIQTLWNDLRGVALLTTGTVDARELKMVTESLVRALAGSNNDAVLVEADGSSAAIQPAAPQAEAVPSTRRGGRAAQTATVQGRSTSAQTLQTADPVEAQGNGRVRRNITSLRQTNSYVVVAGPRLDDAAELNDLVGLVDHAIVVVQRGVRARDLRAAHGLDPKIVGAILIG